MGEAISMNIREKTPDKILVSTEALKIAVSNDKRQKETEVEFENSKNVFLALLGALVSCLLTLIPSWNSWGIVLKVTILGLSILFFLLTLWFGVKMLQSRKKLKNIQPKELSSYIIDEAKDNILYTALLVICYQHASSGEVKFMTEKNGNYLIHCKMASNKTAIGQKEDIINYLATSYNVQKNRVVDVIPLSDVPFFSIKPINGEIKQNGFIFFQVKLKKSLKQSLINHRNVLWKSIQEMEELPDLMGRNQDIVMALGENKTKIVDSFEDIYGPLHIIWNITSECPYHCAICATNDSSREELSIEDKLQVLDHILSVKRDISTLDFAGGDPMYKNEIRTVIKQAINALEEDQVSITTTGLGIQTTNAISEDTESRLLRKCEITIDASHENLAQSSQKSMFSRKVPEYCSHNYKQIRDVSESLQHLIINIPLLDDDLRDDEINNLIEMLQRLKEECSYIRMEAQIIRLMPVGAFSDYYKDIEKYKKYAPMDTAKKISKRINEIEISCRYHCSLRVLPGIGICEERCHMLERKIGIDCAGNVFACTWGAYLRLPDNCDVTQNPFYLGNLVSSSLKKILSGQGTKTSAYRRLSRDIRNNTKKPYCEAVSWFFQKVIDKNGDPLSE